ncbi:MAG: cation diffusion facilitator family transporter [Arenicellales bacterium]|jgi:cation diffusion facilitator family transporter|nr:cation diffusion facilitator family transporter [Arenicellales bacterium]
MNRGSSEQPSTGALNHSGPRRYKASIRITLIGVLVNIGLATAQFLVGIIGHSQALVADGVHTLSDLISDVIVFLAIRQGSKEADREHPYGHSRFETVATVAVGVLLGVAAVGIVMRAIERLLEPGEIVVPTLSALIVAAVAVGAKEALYRFTILVADRFDSSLLRANAWHHRSDALSSVIVLVGIGGSIAGIPVLDGVAAIIVAIMIGRMGWRLGWEATQELVDTGLDENQLSELKSAVMEVEGVEGLHMMRTRRMGGRALVDLHIEVDGEVSISEGHHISEKVRCFLLDKFEELTDVMVHIDPEDDQFEEDVQKLPNRHNLEEALKEHFERLPHAPSVEHFNFHYLNGQVQVEAVVSLSALPQEGDLLGFRDLLRRSLADCADDPVLGLVSSIDVLYH